MRIINELIVKDVQVNIDFFTKYFEFELSLLEKENNEIRFAELKKDDLILYLQNVKFTKKEFKNFSNNLTSSNLILFFYNSKKEFDRVVKKLNDSEVEIYSNLKETFYNAIEIVILTPDKYLIEICCDKE